MISVQDRGGNVTNCRTGLLPSPAGLDRPETPAYRSFWRQAARLRVSGDPEDEDPIVSVVNVVDVFLVVIAVLLVIVAANPLNPFSSERLVVVTNPGKDDMRILIKESQEPTRYETTGEIGQGQGVRAGTAHRLRDGRMIYVP